MWYNSKTSCKYSLKAHIILVCKYRKKLLQWWLNDDIKNMVFDISKMEDTKFTIEVMESDKDHLHLLIDYEPNVSISQIIRRLKWLSTFRIRKLYWEYLRKEFWVEQTFRSDWYFVCSIWEANPDTIRKYIEQQW